MESLERFFRDKIKKEIDIDKHFDMSKVLVNAKEVIEWLAIIDEKNRKEYEELLERSKQSFEDGYTKGCKAGSDYVIKEKWRF